MPEGVQILHKEEAIMKAKNRASITAQWINAFLITVIMIANHGFGETMLNSTVAIKDVCFWLAIPLLISVAVTLFVGPTKFVGTGKYIYAIEMPGERVLRELEKNYQIIEQRDDVLFIVEK